MWSLRQRYLWSAALTAFAATPAVAQPPVTVEQVTAAWRARQDRIQSVRFEWTMRQTVPKGSLDIGMPPSSKPEGVNPPRDLMIEKQLRLSLDGTKFRYSSEGNGWSSRAKDVRRNLYAATFGDGVEKVLMQYSGDLDHPQARIARQPNPTDASAAVAIPVVYWARGTDPTFQPPKLNTYEATGRLVEVDGRPCVELQHLIRAIKRTDTLFVDPAREYVIVRRSSTTGDVVTFLQTIAYDRDPNVGWVPKTWDYVFRLPNGAMLAASRNTVTRYEVNVNLPAGEFELDMPPGTRVSDNSSGQEGQYVIHSDGRAGGAIPSSERPSYAQLAAEPPAGTRRLLLWLAWGGGVAFVLALITLYVFRVKHRTVQLPPSV